MNFLHVLGLSMLFAIGHIDFGFGYAPQITALSLCSKTRSVWNSALLAKESENEDGVDLDSTKRKKSTEPMSLVEYAQKEREAAQKLSNRLLLPDRIGKAVNATLYAFVILGFLLNLFGFAYVRKPDGSLSIGTMETRKFQEEINRTMKPAPKQETSRQD